MRQMGTKADRCETRGSSLHTTRRTFVGALGGAVAAATAGSWRLAGAQTPDAATPVTTTGAIAIYPAPDTVTASPTTEISFRGVTSEQLGTVRVLGGRSGSHAGVLHDHADGQGTSFVPDSPFRPGEWVTVRAGVPLGTGSRDAVKFRVSVPSVPVATPASAPTDEADTPPQTFRSRPDLLPPPITVTEHTEAADEGLVFLGAKIEEGVNGAMIVDNAGELVWFAPLEQGVAVHNDVRVQEYQGEPVITMWEGIAKQGTGFGHVAIVNQRYERIANVQVGNGYPGIDQHEVVITSRGTMLVIIYNPIRWDLSGLGGRREDDVLDNVIQEIEIETGRVVFEWHCLDHIDLDEAGGSAPDDPEEPWDYVHLNSIEEDADGNLITSGRHTHAIYKIDRATGEIVWRLNGKKSDFRMGEGTEFAFQHDARVHPNGELSLFDNASANQDDDDTVDSRGMVLRLDEEAKTATLLREYVHPTGVLSVSQGNMQVLPNGNVFVGWGSAPVYSEFSEDGELVHNGRLPIGGSSYRAYRYPWQGTPAAPPDVVVERQAGDDVTLYVSWNGATGVASWQVLAGPGEDDLAPIADVPREGFETAIPATTAEPWVAVQAVGGDGTVLAQSIAVEVAAGTQS